MNIDEAIKFLKSDMDIEVIRTKYHLIDESINVYFDSDKELIEYAEELEEQFKENDG